MITDISAQAIDLFCGIGGLSYGLREAGIEVSAGIDIDPSCRFAFESNCKAKFIQANIRAVGYSDISPYYKNVKHRILVGCAPCQPFSTHTNKNRKYHEDDRWNLVDEFRRLIVDGKPEIVSMENVPALRSTEVYNTFKNELRRLDYWVEDGVLSCDQFGVPQKRRRLVLLASTLDKISLPQGNCENTRTVAESIGHLSPLVQGSSDINDPIHVCSRLSDLNQRRIKASSPAGTWKDWPDELLPDCYRRKSGQKYVDIYGRMSWNKPAPTLTTRFITYGTGRFGHPEQDRGLSLREGALLQTFPQDYHFVPNGQSPLIGTVGRHIGNAVPPLLAQAIGKTIVNHLKNSNA